MIEKRWNMKNQDCEIKSNQISPQIYSNMWADDHVWVLMTSRECSFYLLINELTSRNIISSDSCQCHRLQTSSSHYHLLNTNNHKYKWIAISLLVLLLRRPTCVRSVVSLQLTALGEGFHTGGTAEDSGFLGAWRRAWLVHSLMFLQLKWIYSYDLRLSSTDTESQSISVRWQNTRWFSISTAQGEHTLYYCADLNKWLV